MVRGFVVNKEKKPRTVINYKWELNYFGGYLMLFIIKPFVFKKESMSTMGKIWTASSSFKKSRNIGIWVAMTSLFSPE